MNPIDDPSLIGSTLPVKCVNRNITHRETSQQKIDGESEGMETNENNEQNTEPIGKAYHSCDNVNDCNDYYIRSTNRPLANFITFRRLDRISIAFMYRIICIEPIIFIHSIAYTQINI